MITSVRSPLVAIKCYTVKTFSRFPGEPKLDRRRASKKPGVGHWCFAFLLPGWQSSQKRKLHLPTIEQFLNTLKTSFSPWMARLVCGCDLGENKQKKTAGKKLYIEIVVHSCTAWVHWAAGFWCCFSIKRHVLPLENCWSPGWAFKSSRNLWVCSHGSCACGEHGGWNHCGVQRWMPWAFRRLQRLCELLEPGFERHNTFLGIQSVSCGHLWPTMRTKQKICTRNHKDKLWCFYMLLPQPRLCERLSPRDHRLPPLSLDTSGGRWQILGRAGETQRDPSRVQPGHHRSVWGVDVPWSPTDSIYKTIQCGKLGSITLETHVIKHHRIYIPWICSFPIFDLFVPPYYAYGFVLGPGQRSIKKIFLEPVPSWSRSTLRGSIFSFHGWRKQIHHVHQKTIHKTPKYTKQAILVEFLGWELRCNESSTRLRCKWLRRRQDPNCQDAEGHPATLVAAAVGSCEILEILLKDLGSHWEPLGAIGSHWDIGWMLKICRRSMNIHLLESKRTCGTVVRISRKCTVTYEPEINKYELIWSYLRMFGPEGLLVHVFFIRQGGIWPLTSFDPNLPGWCQHQGSGRLVGNAVACRRRIGAAGLRASPFGAPGGCERTTGSGLKRAAHGRSSRASGSDPFPSGSRCKTGEQRSDGVQRFARGCGAWSGCNQGDTLKESMQK